jgi:hypothetical protein
MRMHTGPFEEAGCKNCPVPLPGPQVLQQPLYHHMLTCGPVSCEVNLQCIQIARSLQPQPVHAGIISAANINTRFRHVQPHLGAFACSNLSERTEVVDASWRQVPQCIRLQLQNRCCIFDDFCGLGKIGAGGCAQVPKVPQCNSGQLQGHLCFAIVNRCIVALGAQ